MAEPACRSRGHAALILAAGLLLAADAAAQTERAEVTRVTGPVERERDGEVLALNPDDLLVAGDRIRTGARGRVALQLPGTGALTLAPEATVQMHSVEPVDPPARMHLARLVLERGALLVDTRGKQQLPPADVRLNVGPMRLRVFGAEIWARHVDGGSEVCLLAGAIEAQAAGQALRLDQAGSCLWADPGGVREVSPDAAALAARLTGTRIDGAERNGNARTTGDPLPALAGEASGWTLVLASLPDVARAEQEAARLRRNGFDTRVLEATRSNGQRAYRVVSGLYASKAGAERELATARSQRGLAGAWVTPAP